MKTKDRIVFESIDMFNKSGVVAVTTNHIAKALNISPGNLYFHFENKEEIIQQIFKMMRKETFQLWNIKKGETLTHPLYLIEKNFELFWKYRFFHREMYYLRRKDPQLSKLWKNHIHKIKKQMMIMYHHWLQKSWMITLSSDEAEFMANVILATSSSFLQFFESAERLPAKKHVDNGKHYVARLLIHWTQDEMRQDFQNFIDTK